MKIYKATTTLDGLLPPLDYTDDKTAAEVILVGGKKFDLAEFPALKGVFKCGVGTDNLAFDEAARRGVDIRLPSDATRGIIFDETASFAVHLCLRMLYQDIGSLEGWKKEPRNALSAKTVLVLGAGNIGGRVVSKLEPLCRVDTYDPMHNAPDELEPKIRAADCITLHMPLVDGTRGFFDAEKLSWMKDGAVLVNTARGPVVDEDALHAELSAGRLRAALDVFSKEPYEGRLLDLHPDPAFLTPHVASTCQEFLEGLAGDFQKFLGEVG